MTLRAQDVSVRYGRRVAVDAVTLDARPGEVLAILGANGSGKSSLLRAVAGVQPCCGTIAWDGAPGGIGYMPQDNAGGAALTAFEVVLLGRLRSLAFRAGDRIEVVERTGSTEDWWTGRVNGRQGVFPGESCLVFCAGWGLMCKQATMSRIRRAYVAEYNSGWTFVP